MSSTTLQLKNYFESDPEIRFAPLERPTELPRSAQIRIPEVIIEEINPTVGTDSGDNELDPTTTLLEETPVTIPTSKLQSWTNNRYRIQVMKNYENQLKEYCPHFVTEVSLNLFHYKILLNELFPTLRKSWITRHKTCILGGPCIHRPDVLNSIIFFLLSVFKNF